jgi:hypothetical protein
MMDAGRIVFRGTPGELITRGETGGGLSDAPLDRAYSSVLQAARQGVRTA